MPAPLPGPVLPLIGGSTRSQLASVAVVPGGRPPTYGHDTADLLDQMSALADDHAAATAVVEDLRARRIALAQEAARRGASGGVIAAALRVSRQQVHHWIGPRNPA